MRHALTAIEAATLLRGRSLVIAPRLEISRSSIRQKHPQGALEVRAGLVEGGGCTILLLARVRSGIETTMPLPRILICLLYTSDAADE